MTNKLVVIINSLKVQKIKKILLYEMKFIVPNYSCLHNPWLGGLSPPDPRSLCPLSSTEFVEPPPRTKFVGTPLPNMTLYTPLLSPSVRATCPTHLILLHMFTRTILNEECKHDVHSYVVFSTPLLPRTSWTQISPSAPYSRTPPAWVPLYVSGKVSQPY